MKKALVFFTVFALLAGCTIQQDRTDAEMFDSANEVYKDYLFEYGIDSTLFSSPKIENRQNEDRSYKWLAKGAGGAPVGIEVIVTKTKGIKPKMILIGDIDTWHPLVGSKNKKRKGNKGTLLTY